ncbi:predicted protein [Haematococcus lacustris]|uniref:Golgi apparatus protein 1 n=1 Tax=Haematococcus lacustris TaxID=44745 RepID=A0A6A0A2N2_HAELA|nr:predicted protein [Haematococcus lacustris]
MFFITLSNTSLANRPALLLATVAATGEACKRQILRLLGLAVEDYRLGETSKACKADVQQYCGGVKADSGSFAGAVHACLRKSWEHLSPGCRRAEQALELAEHEDVRLNPRIQRECPLAIKQFCDSVPAGNANVLSCLQSASSKPSFPQDCKSAIDKLLERAHAKYSLNIKLKAACDPDVSQMCPGASDEPQRVSDPGILGCLASNSSALSAPCRVELAALVHVHLDRYRIGMPLTSPCDGDVMARCNVDKQVTPFLMGGVPVQTCSRAAQAMLGAHIHV